MIDVDPKMLEEIDEYLTGRLSDDEQDSFEERLLGDVVLQNELEEQIAFREALKSESALLLAAPDAGLFSKLHSWLVSPAWAYTSTTAVVLLILVVFGVQDGANELSQQGVLRNVEFTRSGADSVIQAPEHTSIILLIDAYGIGATQAKFLLVLNGKTVTEVSQLEPDENQLFNIVVGPLDAGRYDAALIKQDGESVNLSIIID